ncbi:hypothetical protein AJ80_05968 [Polytolypa hystricis UAMH7299]|uniref:Rhodopsin domain-containing protein n=1 Tax=Polytolypa hystricis (strain UAMH7299) TaxID=1447883 RepID=A0A2B7Y0Q5_POLH7|nr:hypothetical protein AJ80_05968 [Polytolypa hystricis UAMH7299]
MASRVAGRHWDPSQLPTAYRNESKVPYLLSVHGILFVIAVIVLLLRVYVRYFMLVGLSVDDYVMLAAGACSIAMLVTFIDETKNGLGRHWLAIPYEQMERFALFAWVSSLFVVTGVNLVKISIGLFLLRVTQTQRWRKFIIFMIVFLILIIITFLGTLIFQCIPVEAAWKYDMRPAAKCFSSETYIAIGIFNNCEQIYPRRGILEPH